MQLNGLDHRFGQAHSSHALRGSELKRKETGKYTYDSPGSYGRLDGILSSTLHFRNYCPELQGMISRWIANEIKRKIAQVPAVALLGARQVGKTTIAKTMSQGLDSIYLDLEAPEDLIKLTDPTSFLRTHSDKLVILDEIQRAPDLFPVLRGLIDKNREEGRKSGQFFFLGSASIDRHSTRSKKS